MKKRAAKAAASAKPVAPAKAGAQGHLDSRFRGNDKESLEKSRTLDNLKKAFLEEAASVFRYLYFATIAEYEGFEKHSATFREFADGGKTCVQGCFDFLGMVHDPDSKISIGGTLTNLESLLQTETRQHNETYPGMAKVARHEGFTDIASWFETLEKLKRSRARRLKRL